MFSLFLDGTLGQLRRFQESLCDATVTNQRLYRSVVNNTVIIIVYFYECFRSILDQSSGHHTKPWYTCVLDVKYKRRDSYHGVIRRLDFLLNFKSKSIERNINQLDICTWQIVNKCSRNDRWPALLYQFLERVNVDSLFLSYMGLVGINNIFNHLCLIIFKHILTLTCVRMFYLYQRCCLFFPHTRIYVCHSGGYELRNCWLVDLGLHLTIDQV